jgi:hypothetical protein
MLNTRRSTSSLDSCSKATTLLTGGAALVMAATAGRNRQRGRMPASAVLCLQRCALHQAV